MNRFKVIYEHIIGSKYASSQEDFAHKTDISRTIVSQLLTGKRVLNDKQIVKICAAFPFVDSEWLRSGEGMPFSYDSKGLPSPEELKDLDSVLLFLNGIDDEQTYTNQLESLAILYASKMAEVQDLYSQMAGLMNQLESKEKENAALSQKVLFQARTLQLLNQELAKLKIKSTNHSQGSADLSTDSGINE